MSASTQLAVIHPATPASVTFAQAADVVRRVGAAAELRDAACTLSYARGCVSRDDVAANALVPTGLPGMFTIRDCYEQRLRPRSRAELLTQLDPIASEGCYRLHAGMGRAHASDAVHLMRQPCDRNRIGLSLTDASLAIGPFEIERDDDEEQVVRLGTVACTLWGYGYCYPWTKQELIERALATRWFAAVRSALLASFGAVRAVGDARAAIGLCSASARLIRGADGDVIVAVDESL